MTVNKIPESLLKDHYIIELLRQKGGRKEGENKYGDST